MKDLKFIGIGGAYALGLGGISQKQIKRIAFIPATDLKNFAESNGNFSLLTANEVYSHLQSNQYNTKERTSPLFFYALSLNFTTP